MFERPRTGERAVLVRLGLGAPADPEDIGEFTQLALSAGAQPVATITGRRERPDPRYFVGSGKAEEIRASALTHTAEVILVDHALSPSQERNLEKLTGRRVLDRNGLILDIFAQRARSHEGKLQVELAQLKHIATRLVRGWTHLERQRGGSIGLRGPGETQLETDRRLVGQRVRVLTRRLEKLQLQRETGRRARAEIPVPSVALVGYTNAGKSTLFRAMTGADAYVADQLFATLDPLVRRLRLPGGTECVFADTVGFIRELPHELIAAFRSTLTEAREATLLLHVIDASDPRRDEHINEVNEVLGEIGAGDIPQIRVYNKIDRLEVAPHLEREADGVPARVWISASRGDGLELLRTAIAERLARSVRTATLRLPAVQGALRSRLYTSGTVRAERALDDGGCELTVELPDVELLVLARTPGVRVSVKAPAANIPAALAGLLESPVPRAAADFR
ncbi:MAG TPA: GTPase HflX [Steroidobacteraceae bacterium]|nr:GTPase HflX [Steroidobacteraceae bacterium]HQX78213.1 GTPase HflX [Steroidobacteraceae bacterium]HQZ80166.1 GTPase HflX [Steroidobacteraceae bacterium]